MGKICNWWKRINSKYEVFEVHQQECLVDKYYEGYFQYTYTARAVFTIKYNKVRNHYMLESSGFRPTEQSRYPGIVQLVNELNNGNKNI